MLSIITYPNPILEQRAELVTFPLNQATKNLISDMWDVVKDKGVGLAAPQVGVSKQIFLVHLSETEKGKSAKDFVVINPKIVFESQVENLMVEGCLSFPGEYWEIWRPANIVLEYQDIKGKKKTLNAKDWLSRVIQHENDHLLGNLYIKKGGRKLTKKELDGENVVID